MVPNGWKIQELSEVANFTSGGTPSKSKSSYWGGTHPWVSGKDLKKHFLNSSIDMLTDEGFNAANKAPSGSTLVLVRGMTLLKDFPVGFATKPLAFNQDIKALAPKKHIDGLFLSYLLAGNKESIRQLVSTAGHGTGRLDTESLKAFPVLIPSRAEQLKISKIILTWDQSIAINEKLLATAKLQKQSLIQLLLTGEKRLNPFSKKWLNTRLMEIYTFKKGKDLSKSDLGTEGKKCILYGELYTKYSEVISIIHSRTISDGGLPSKARDILIPASTTTKGVDLANATAVLEDGVHLGGDIIVLRPKKDLDASFMAYLLTHIKKHDIASRAQGITIIHLYGKDLQTINVFIPTEIEEQNKIAAALTTASLEIKNIQAKLTCLKQEKKALMQQLLTGKRRVKVDAVEARADEQQ